MASELAEVKVAKAANLASYGGAEASMEDRIAAAVAANPVVIFSKLSCPFCLEVRQTFEALGVAYNDFQMDSMPQGGEAWSALKKKYNHNTVPYVFINQAFIGGCDSLKALQYNGELAKQLKVAGYTIPTAAMTSLAACAVVEPHKRAGGTLFSFPEAVDNRQARLNGLWAFTICLLVAIYFYKPAAHWVMVGLLVDFVMRFLGGGNFSPLGALSTAVVAFMELVGSKPHWVAGPPKQFATSCGVMFSAVAVLFYLCGAHNDKLHIVGLSFTCALGLACFMEAFLDFCLGCFFFQLGITFGIVPKDSYTTFVNSKEEIDYTYNFIHQDLNEGAPPCKVKHFDDAHPTAIDYRYKAKTEDMTKEDFHIIKHVKITHFIMHMGITGLACVWRAADPAVALDTPAAVWQAIGILAAILYCTWIVLYALKMLMYPRKVWKEWMHNVNGNAFMAPFLTCILFAYLVSERDPRFAAILFWMGAPQGLLLSLIRVGDWICTSKEIEHVNAAWLLMPVGNFVAALVGPVIDPMWRNAMQAWFAFALIMWITLFIITFLKVVTITEQDDRVRCMLGIWIAAPAVGAVAYLSCYGGVGAVVTGPVTAGAGDFIFINLHWIAVVTALVLLMGLIRPYFGRMRFEMAYWAAAFPLDALALTCIAYNQQKRGDLSQAFAYAAIAAACFANVTLFFLTLAGLLRRKIFVPDYKWGPLSFMRITHEALRGSLPKLMAAAKAAGDDASNAAFRTHWDMFLLAQAEHGRHEDEVLFKAYDEIIPGVSQLADEQHRELQHEMEEISAAVLAQGKGSAADADAMVGRLEHFTTALEAHLQTEELHMQAMPRKYVPVAMAKTMVRKCWEITPAATWFQLLPWIVNHLPMLAQRVRFLKTLLWSMPERAQQMGIMLALGVDPVQWRRITDELPELIPRGAAGWERYY